MIRRILLLVVVLLPTAGLFAKPSQPNAGIESLEQLTAPAIYPKAFQRIHLVGKHTRAIERDLHLYLTGGHPD